MHEWPDVKIRELAGANAYLREENTGQLMAAKKAANNTARAELGGGRGGDD